MKTGMDCSSEPVLTGKVNFSGLLIDATKYCSLGQLTVTKFELGDNIGGICRRQCGPS